jgi:hypothetical protein
MQFFFPDSQDQVNPDYDFVDESYPPHRIRQRDDRYAHEVLAVPPYDGMLISKSIIDGTTGAPGKYSEAGKLRLYREGVHQYFRLPTSQRMEVIGDCGAFTYRAASKPPYSPAEVLEFNLRLGTDIAISPDHLVFSFSDCESNVDRALAAEFEARRELTLSMAREFLQIAKSTSVRLTPGAVAHGWSVSSYVDSVRDLVRLGYAFIALGGMVPMKTPQILSVLETLHELQLTDQARIHLLGITRLDALKAFSHFGVDSFDSTSPFLQSFRDGEDNYYLGAERFKAIRIPQSDSTTAISKQINSGKIDQATYQRAESSALRAVRQYGVHARSVEDTVSAVLDLYQVIGRHYSTREQLARTLSARPWDQCRCAVCMRLGIEVVVFRGTERNKSRGFHNLHQFHIELNLQRTRRDLCG